MSSVCRVALAEINEALMGERTREAMWDLPLDAAPEQIFDVLTAELPQSSQDLLRREFETFPQSFLPMVLVMWREADEAGKSFKLHSLPPSRVLDAARRGRVSHRIDHDDEGTEITISHVANHHAEWFSKPVPEAVPA